MRAAAAAAAALLLPQGAAAGEVVRTTGGLVAGADVGGVASFQGVPYAAAPTGALRWQPPAPHRGWNGTLDVSAPLRVGCPQACTLPPITCPPVTQEDCLLLNVYAPAGAPGSARRLPVLFFIHGGNFHAGFAGGTLYNGTVLARENGVVVVAINYRLGALGWLRHKEIEGNYGLLDQRAAMAWVRDNIAAFGGDASDVTLFGQSAGGQSVTIHALNKDITTLGVRRVIIESSPWGLPYRTDKTWGGIVQALAMNASCSCIPEGCIARCLKALDVDALIAAQVVAETNLLLQANDLFGLFEPWNPTQGTDLLPDHPLRMFQNGQGPYVPVVNGAVRDEGLMFIYEAFGTPVSKLEGEAIIAVLMGVKTAAKVIEQYGPSITNKSDARPTVSVVATDGLFHCPGRNALTHVAGDSWLYEFAHTMSFYGNGSFGGTQPECTGEVCHAAELPFVFYPDNIRETIGQNYTEEEGVLGASMSKYWAGFAKAGAPGEGDARWPLQWAPFTAGAGPLLRFQTPADVAAGDVWAEKCAAWDSTGYPWLA